MNPSFFVNAVYYPNYRVYEERTPQTLNIDQVSHIFYAFAGLKPDGTVFLQDPWVDTDRIVDENNGGLRACVALKLQKPGLKIILSIGGGGFCSQSPDLFPRVAASPTLRSRFGSSARLLVDEFNLDGIDIDWERPSDEREGRDFVSLLETCRTQLADTTKYTLTAALPAGEWALRNIDMQKASTSLTFINLMCYDFFGPWSDTAGFHAQLFATSLQSVGTICGAETISYLRRRGVPASKMTLGIPLYGRVFKGVTRLGQALSDKQERVALYRDLPVKGHVEHVNHQAVAAHCVDADGSLITYDNAFTVGRKAQYVVENGLCGIFFWEATGDKAGKDSLTLVSSNVFRSY